MRNQTPNCIDQLDLRSAVRDHAARRNLKDSRSPAPTSHARSEQAGRETFSNGLDLYEKTPEASSREKQCKIPAAGKLRDSELEANPASLLASSLGPHSSGDEESGGEESSGEESVGEESRETEIDYDDLFDTPAFFAEVDSSPSDCSTDDRESGGEAVFPALHHAARLGRLESVKRFVNRGADVNSRNHRYRTPLHECAKNGHLPIARFLIRKGADPNARDEFRATPLHKASLLDAPSRGAETAGLLIRSGARLEACDELGEMPLHKAARMGNEGVALRLIEAGSSTEQTGGVDTTPLHLAVDSKHSLAVVRVLVGKGADPEARDVMEETPLHRAASNASAPEVIECLIGAGAAANARNVLGDTPLDLATPNKSSNRQTRTVLRSFGAKRSEELSDTVVTPSGELDP